MGFHVLGIRSRGPGFGHEVWRSKSKTEGENHSEFEILGFVVRASNFGFRVSSSGCQVFGFGHPFGGRNRVIEPLVVDKVVESIGQDLRARQHFR